MSRTRKRLLPSRIGLRMLAAIVGASTLIAALAIVLHLFINYRSDTHRLESDLDLIAHSVVPNLALSIWNYDREQMRVQLEALASVPQVGRVTLELTEQSDGEVLSAGTIDPAAEPLERSYEVALAPQGQPRTTLGTLHFSSSLEPIRAATRAQLLQIVLIQVGNIFVLSAVILWLLHGLLVRHVTAIAGYAQRTSVDTLGEELRLDRGAHVPDDELEDMVRALNGMRTKLIEDIAARSAYVAALGEERVRAAQEKERAELERARAELLAEANRDLESFSYSISHDLRAPLRAITGFTAILQEDHAAQLPPEAREHLDRIQSRAQRMGTLIDDLLSFSRATRAPLTREPVDLRALAEQAWADMREAQPACAAVLEIGALPPAEGDRALLLQVLVNLLGNACKYTVPGRPPRIEVGWDGSAYYVSDNGAGFDMTYADRLFGVFARLHSAGDYEGTGIGLAIVRRIIERHGGRIWASAVVNEGARFSFTLGATGS
jgi:signal transduction histidine kinase